MTDTPTPTPAPEGAPLTGVVRTARDETCPHCGHPETYTARNYDVTPPLLLAHGCAKCGWTTSRWAELHPYAATLTGDEHPFRTMPTTLVPFLRSTVVEGLQAAAAYNAHSFRSLHPAFDDADVDDAQRHTLAGHSYLLIHNVWNHYALLVALHRLHLVDPVAADDVAGQIAYAADAGDIAEEHLWGWASARSMDPKRVVDEHNQVLAEHPDELPTLLAELRALRHVRDNVLALHAPVPVYPLTDDGAADTTAEPIAMLCAHCSDPDDLAALEDGDWTEGRGEPWPCPSALTAMDTSPDAAVQAVTR